MLFFRGSTLVCFIALTFNIYLSSGIFDFICTEKGLYTPYIRVYKGRKGTKIYSSGPGFYDLLNQTDLYICVNGPVFYYFSINNTNGGVFDNPEFNVSSHICATYNKSPRRGHNHGASLKKLHGILLMGNPEDYRKPAIQLIPAPNWNYNTKMYENGNSIISFGNEDCIISKKGVNVTIKPPKPKMPGQSEFCMRVFGESTAKPEEEVFLRADSHISVIGCSPSTTLAATAPISKIPASNSPTATAPISKIPTSNSPTVTAPISTAPALNETISGRTDSSEDDALNVKSKPVEKVLANGVMKDGLATIPPVTNPRPLRTKGPISASPGSEAPVPKVPTTIAPVPTTPVSTKLKTAPSSDAEKESFSGRTDSSEDNAANVQSKPTDKVVSGGFTKDGLLTIPTATTPRPLSAPPGLEAPVSKVPITIAPVSTTAPASTKQKGPPASDTEKEGFSGRTDSSEDNAANVQSKPVDKVLADGVIKDGLVVIPPVTTPRPLRTAGPISVLPGSQAPVSKVPTTTTVAPVSAAPVSTKPKAPPTSDTEKESFSGRTDSSEDNAAHVISKPIDKVVSGGFTKDGLLTIPTATTSRPLSAPPGLETPVSKVPITIAPVSKVPTTIAPVSTTAPASTKQKAPPASETEKESFSGRTDSSEDNAANISKPIDKVVSGGFTKDGHLTIPPVTTPRPLRTAGPISAPPRSEVPVSKAPTTVAPVLTTPVSTKLKTAPSSDAEKESFSGRTDSSEDNAANVQSKPVDKVLADGVIKDGLVAIPPLTTPRPLRTKSTAPPASVAPASIVLTTIAPVSTAPGPTAPVSKVTTIPVAGTIGPVSKVSTTTTPVHTTGQSPTTVLKITTTIGPVSTVETIPLVTTPRPLRTRVTPSPKLTANSAVSKDYTARLHANEELSSFTAIPELPETTTGTNVPATNAPVTVPLVTTRRPNRTKITPSPKLFGNSAVVKDYAANLIRSQDFSTSTETTVPNESTTAATESKPPGSISPQVNQSNKTELGENAPAKVDKLVTDAPVARPLETPRPFRTKVTPSPKLLANSALVKDYAAGLRKNGDASNNDAGSSEITSDSPGNTTAAGVTDAPVPASLVSTTSRPSRTKVTPSPRLTGNSAVVKNYNAHLRESAGDASDGMTESPENTTVDSESPGNTTGQGNKTLLTGLNNSSSVVTNSPATTPPPASTRPPSRTRVTPSPKLVANSAVVKDYAAGLQRNTSPSSIVPDELSEISMVDPESSGNKTTEPQDSAPVVTDAPVTVSLSTSRPSRIRVTPSPKLVANSAVVKNYTAFVAPEEVDDPSEVAPTANEDTSSITNASKMEDNPTPVPVTNPPVPTRRTKSQSSAKKAHTISSTDYAAGLVQNKRDRRAGAPNGNPNVTHPPAAPISQPTANKSSGVVSALSPPVPGTTTVATTPKVIEITECEPLPILTVACDAGKPKKEHACGLLKSMMGTEEPKWPAGAEWRQVVLELIVEIYSRRCRRIPRAFGIKIVNIFKFYLVNALTANALQPQREAWKFIMMELNACKQRKTQILFKAKHEKPGNVYMMNGMKIPIRTSTTEEAENEYDFNWAVEMNWKMFSTVLAMCIPMSKPNKASLSSRFYTLYIEDFFNPINQTWIEYKDNLIFQLILGEYYHGDTEAWINNYLEASFLESNWGPYRPIRPILVHDSLEDNYLIGGRWDKQ